MALVGWFFGSINPFKKKPAACSKTEWLVQGGKDWAVIRQIKTHVAGARGNNDVCLRERHRPMVWEGVNSFFPLPFPVLGRGSFSGILP